MTNNFPRMLEATIEETCTVYLALDGWRGLKTNPVSNQSRGAGFGEPGMADHQYIRYLHRECAFPDTQFIGRIYVELMWIEWKRQRGGKVTSKAEKAKIHQLQWRDLERRRGAFVLLAGVDFPATIEGFMEWYEVKSGLNQKLNKERRQEVARYTR